MLLAVEPRPDIGAPIHILILPLPVELVLGKLAGIHPAVGDQQQPLAAAHALGKHTGVAAARRHHIEAGAGPLVGGVGAKIRVPVREGALGLGVLPEDALRRPTAWGRGMGVRSQGWAAGGAVRVRVQVGWAARNSVKVPRFRVGI